MYVRKWMKIEDSYYFCNSKAWKHWQCIRLVDLLNSLFRVLVTGGKPQLRYEDDREQFYGPHNMQHMADFSYL